MSQAASIADDSAEAQMGAVVDDLLDRLDRGERPQIEEYTARYPQLAAVLRHMLPALEVMRSAAAEPTRTAAGDEEIRPEGPLGDFRIVREVGRGGMGIVYEAVQLSLGRRVALKVLPFAAALDPKQLQRFKNEAQAAAGLHHQSIVPVYGVGCERGVHYYAMQFVEGQTLAQLILDRRALGGREVPPGPEPASRLGPEPQDADPQRTEPYPSPAADTAPQAGACASTERPAGDLAYYRTAARLGIEAAEALEHAHQLGVVHRDVKPANLLVDARGHLWVTDFGLAHCQSQAGLTMTGDLLGTLRYMSPEQALAKRVPLDHRTDVYALGATLYELLTLEPAFPGTDRQELLRRIAFEEPRPPRRLNRAVPAELETIVLKALEKNPAERYASAQELADDLRRFLEDRPIRARRPTVVQKVRKWARRNRTVVWSAGAALLATVVALAGSVGWAVRDRAARETALDREVDRTLDEAADRIGKSKWPEAEAAVQRADKLLRAAGRTESPLRLQELQQDVAMARRLEDIYSHPSRQESYTGKEQDAAYAQAFRDYGIDLAGLPPAEAAERIQGQSIRADLSRALDIWSFARRRAGSAGVPDWKQLLEVAEAADPDDRRNQLRAALRHDDRRTLEALAASADVRRLPPETLTLLGKTLGDSLKAPEQAVALLRQAQRQYPADLWINDALGWYCYNLRQYDDSVRFFTAARALRPDSPYLVEGIGRALVDKGALPEAAAEFAKAIEMKPDFALAHNNLGAVLGRQGKLAEAGAEYREAIRCQPDYALAHYNLGGVLELQGKLAEAEAEYREATRRQPDFAPAHNNLGGVLRRQGKLAEAEGPLREAIRLRPGHAGAHRNLGMVLERRGKLAEAEAEYREAIRRQPDFARGQHELGGVLRRQGKLAEAEGPLREAIRLQPGNAGAHRDLGVVLERQGKLAEAEAEYRETVRLQPGNARAHYDLGVVLERQGKLAEAEAEFRETVRLKSDHVDAHNALAWLLATCADPQRRKPQEAVTLAERAVELAPKDEASWNTLAAARYRAGDYRAAIAALEKSMALRHGGDSLDWFFLAMAYWRLGEQEQARQWYGKAVSWMEKHRPKDEELVRFRAEAAELLGMNKK
jgi:serine/threonine protein kinase/Flp pilus assembly protein TadD